MVGEELLGVCATAIEAHLGDAGIVRMHTGDPGASGNDNVLAEGDGYLHLTGVAFSASGAEVSNDDIETLGARTGGGDVQLTHYSILTGTTVHIARPLNGAPIAYNVGAAAPSFAVGSLTITAAEQVS